MKQRMMLYGLTLMLGCLVFAACVNDEEGPCLSDGETRVLFVLSLEENTKAVTRAGQETWNNYNPKEETINLSETTYGRNSITVFGTHHIIYATVGVLLEITDYAATPVWAGIIMLGAVALLEIPIIYIVNHWLPFLAGKHYTRRSA